MTLVERGVGKGRGRGDVGLPWTDERVTMMVKLMRDGLSAAGIAREMGGITRNGVIGKIHRLGLSNRKLAAPAAAIAGPIKPRMHQLFNERRASELRPKKIYPKTDCTIPHDLEPEPITDLPPDTSAFACTIAGLELGMCRYPLGDPSADMQYCGAAVIAGAWCPRHRRIVYTPLQPRRRP